MLRQLVMMENALLEEKSQKESARLAQKLDLLEAECAKELAAYIREHDMENSPDRKGACRAYVSDSCEQFKRHAGMFLQDEDVMQVEQVSPET